MDHEEQIQMIASLVRKKFTSGNDVKIDRITIKREEVLEFLEPPELEALVLSPLFVTDRVLGRWKP